MLNVIKEKEVRLNILKEISQDYLKKGCPLFITVYEGNRSGVGKESKKGCWQNNMKLRDYFSEVETYFDFALISNGVIIAWNRGANAKTSM